jgi:hypothetical protein
MSASERYDTVSERVCLNVKTKCCILEDGNVNGDFLVCSLIKTLSNGIPSFELQLEIDYFATNRALLPRGPRVPCLLMCM